MPEHYVILSLKYSSRDEQVFWRSNNAGYTNVPWFAGIYTEEEVKADPAYYNDGYNTIAIPLTNQAVREDSGLVFKLDMKRLKAYIAANRYNQEVRDDE